MTNLILPSRVEFPERYNCFIVFEPAALRIHDNDILLLGDKVLPFFEKVYAPFQNFQADLREEMLFNRLSKFNQMLDLVSNKNQLVVTRFFDRIWRRYGYVSHLGEVLFSLEDLLNYFPEYAKDPKIIAERQLVTEEEVFEDDVDG